MSGHRCPFPNTDPSTFARLRPLYPSSADSDSGASSDQPYHPWIRDTLPQPNYIARSLRSFPLPPASPPIDDTPYLPESRPDTGHNRPSFPIPTFDEPELQQSQTLEHEYTQPNNSYAPSYITYDHSVHLPEVEHVQWRPRTQDEYRLRTHSFPSAGGSPAPVLPFDQHSLPNTYSMVSSPSSTPPSVYEPRQSSDPPAISLESPFHPPLGDVGPFLRRQLKLDADAEVNLQSLTDPPFGVKPPYPLPLLIKLAIYGSPTKRLTLQEIYAALENRFEWFRENSDDKAWKNSIRHNLSLNKVFRSVPRPITEPGKGSYWHVDMSEGEGYKRPRKRKFNGMRGSRSPTVADQNESSDGEDDAARDANVDPESRWQSHRVGQGRTRSPLDRRTNLYPQPVARSSSQSRPTFSLNAGTSNIRSNAPSGSSSGSMSPASTSSASRSASANELTAVQGRPQFSDPSFRQPSFGQPTFVQPHPRQCSFGQPSFAQAAFNPVGYPKNRSVTAAINLPPAFMLTGEYVSMSAVGRSNTGDRTTQMGRSPSGDGPGREQYEPPPSARHPTETDPTAHAPSSSPSWDLT